MKLELPRGAFGGDKWIERYYTLNTLDYLSIGQNGNVPGTFIEDVNFRIPSNDPACPECGAIDSELKPMRQQELVAQDVQLGDDLVHPEAVLEHETAEGLLARAVR